jgi:hypothetical protein
MIEAVGRLGQPGSAGHVRAMLRVMVRKCLAGTAGPAGVGGLEP